jgi:hypothetical protein
MRAEDDSKSFFEKTCQPSREELFLMVNVHMKVDGLKHFLRRNLRELLRLHLVKASSVKLT